LRSGARSLAQARIWKLGEAARRRYELRSLQVVFHVAAPCPAWLKEAFIGWLGADVIHELYGATEGQATTQQTEHTREETSPRGVSCGGARGRRARHTSLAASG